MSGELVGRARAEAWLSAGLCLIRLGKPANEIARVAPWIVAAFAEKHALPPVGVTADVGRLATGASLDVTTPIPDTTPALRAAVRAYEDHLLARLAADPRMDAVGDAIARLPASQWADAVAVLTGHVLDRIGYREGTAVSVGTARRITQRPTADLVSAGLTALRSGGEIADRLAVSYEELARAARQTRALLGDAEVFVLENLGVLRTLTQRLAIEQVVEVAEELEKTLPRRLKPRSAARGHVPAQIEDDASFPMGGFSSVSTVGSLENLVVSELVYMEDNADLDLFDVRYVEGELLYYMRDESIHVRRRREITFALMPDLARARFKDPGLSWQRLVIALGALLCSVRRLTRALSEEALFIDVVFVKDAGGRSPLAAERGLAELLLAEWRERGVARVSESRSLEETAKAAAGAAARAQTDLVVLCAGPSPALVAEPGARLGVLHLGGPAPSVSWSGREEPPEPARSPWEAWTEATLELLEELV